MTYIHYEHPDKDIFLIDMRAERQYPFSALVEKWLRKYIQQGQKIAILTNKKGYATGTICQDCGHIPRCDNCDIAVAIHKDSHGSRFGICHICKRQYSYTPACTNCGGYDTQSYGVGTQQITEYIQQTYGIIPLQIVSELVNSPPKIASIMSEISSSQVVVGTSLLSIPPGNISFDIVVVMYADMGLHIPDYQSNWHNFLFLYEVFMQHSAPTFLVQSYHPEHYSLQHACNMDLAAMQEEELAWRKTNAYPPHTDMCVLLYKHEIEERLYGATNKLYQELLFLKEQYEMEDLEIYTTPPLIYKIYGKYRYNIILKGSQLRQFMDIAYSKLKMRSRGFKVDWEPMQLL